MTIVDRILVKPLSKKTEEEEEEEEDKKKSL